MLTFPLCFRYLGSVIGRGFIAKVDFQGRVLAVIENDGAWLNGVNPGAVAAGDKTLDDANRTLRDTMTKVFIDFAEEAEDFDGFRRRVEEFYHATDSDLDEWNKAVELIRSGNVQIPEGIKRCPDPEYFVHVTAKTMAQLTPEDNPLVLKESQPALATVA